MAETSYNIWAESFPPDLTAEEAEQCFQQCLVDFRRMLVDVEYGRPWGFHDPERDAEIKHMVALDELRRKRHH